MIIFIYNNIINNMSYNMSYNSDYILEKIKEHIDSIHDFNKSDIHDIIHETIDNYVTYNSIEENKLHIDDVYDAIKLYETTYGEFLIKEKHMFYAQLAFVIIHEYILQYIDELNTYYQSKFI